MRIKFKGSSLADMRRFFQLGEMFPCQGVKFNTLGAANQLYMNLQNKAEACGTKPGKQLRTIEASRFGFAVSCSDLFRSSSSSVVFSPSRCQRAGAEAADPHVLQSYPPQTPVTSSFGVGGMCCHGNQGSV